MTQQTINVGAAPNDNTGDPLRNAYIKCNDNFSELYPAVNGKEPVIAAGTTAQYWRGDKSWQTLDKTAVGLPNVDDSSDASKPVSTATQSALDGKAASARIIASGGGLTGGGNLTADRTLAVGAGTGITVNADNVALTVPVSVANGGTGTATGISAATQTALDAKVAKGGDTMTGGLTISTGIFHAADGLIQVSKSTVGTGYVGAGAALFSGLGNNDLAIRADNYLALGSGANVNARILIEPAGNVGIGTAVPGAKLEVSSPTSGDTMRLSGTQAPKISLMTAGGATMRNWGMATNTAVAGDFHIMQSADNAAVPATSRFILRDDGAVLFPSAIGIGTTANAANVHIDMSGNTNRLLVSTSSRIYKDNIVPVTSEDAKVIDLMNPIKYQSKAPADNPNRIHYGLIAEEVAELDTRLIHYDGLRPDGVQYERIIPLLIRRLQDILSRLEALEKLLPQPIL